MTWMKLPGYRILGELGSGGMATVFKAQRLKDKAIVALKTIRSDKLAEAPPVYRAQFRERLVQEYSVASRLSGLCPERWVRVFEGQVDRDPMFYIMELVEGGTLEDYLKRHGRLRLEDAVWVVCEAALAVSVLHEKVVGWHRDLTLKNFFLRGQPSRGLRSCQVIGADCGICKDSVKDVSLTLAGQRIGPPTYARAPEQLDHVRGPTSPATDVWQLGILLYYLIKGNPPFASEYEILNDRTPCIPEANAVLESIYRRCLAKEPEFRYSNAQELAKRLTAVVEGVPVA
jgi:serine/threonine protein kinase